MPSKYYLTVKKKIVETKDSVSLHLSVPLENRNLFFYTPAQFLTFYLTIKGQSYRRSYSLSSTPFLKEDLQTTVKRVPKGVVSNYIVSHVTEGEKILSTTPKGKFFKPPTDLEAKHYYLFAAGSGITPIFSILKTVLLSDSQHKVTLFYANRSEESIIYHQALKNWQKKYPNFRVIHALSRPQQNWCLIKGRLNKEHLQTHLGDVLTLKSCIVPNSKLFYLCGPLAFMQTVEDFLLAHSVLPSHIYKESFSSSRHKIAEVKGQVKNPKKPGSNVCSQNPFSSQVVVTAEKDAQTNPPKTIIAYMDGKKISIKAKKHIPILEQLLSAGYHPPFSCMSGSCMSCLAVLKKGCIVQNERGILEDSNIQKKEILTCQAKPEASIVEVDYNV